MRATILILASSLILAPTMPVAKMLRTEAEIRGALIGNTISGEEEGKAYYEYFRSDGGILGEEDGERYLGRWRISDGRMCMSYDEDGSDAKMECSKVDFYGCGVLWIDDDGALSFSTVLGGNPKGF